MTGFMSSRLELFVIFAAFCSQSEFEQKDTKITKKRGNRDNRRLQQGWSIRLKASGPECPKDDLPDCCHARW